MERQPAAGGFTLNVEEDCEVVIQSLSDRRLLHPPISVPKTTTHPVQLTLIPVGHTKDHKTTVTGGNLLQGIVDGQR